MEEIEIREATKGDVAVFAEYRYRMFRDMEPGRDFSRIKDAFVKKSREYYANHLGSDNGYDCVAVVDGRVVACGSIVFRDRPPHIDHFENDLGYIHSIYVEDEFRRRGISKAIMARLHEEARKHGMHKTGLHASEYGRLIYESMGYTGNSSYMELGL